MEDGITTEVMIWTDQSIIEPAGTQISVPFFNGYFYSLYQEEFENWTYFAFVSDTPQHQGTLNVHYFISYMIALGLLDQDEYIGSFEMGNEVVYGTGSTDVHDYSVSINENLQIVEFDKENKSSVAMLTPKPNPFNNQVVIPIRLDRSKNISVLITDITGRTIKNLLMNQLSAGLHQIKWNGESDNGSFVGSGLYFVNVSTSISHHQRKLVLLK